MVYGIPFNIVEAVERQRSVIIALPRIFGVEASRSGVIPAGAEII
jgi:hypothetical protein